MTVQPAYYPVTLSEPKKKSECWMKMEKYFNERNWIRIGIVPLQMEVV